MADPIDPADDELDPALLAGAVRLEAMPAPDVWPEVLERARRTDTSAPTRRSPVRPLAAAAALLLALTTVVLLGGEDEPVSLTVAGQPEPTPTARAAIGITTGSGDACSNDLVDELRRGVAPEPRSGASDSPEQLSLISARVLRGEITGVRPSQGGSFLLFELDGGPDADDLADAPGRRAALWTDGAPSEDFRASFVAFIVDAPVEHEDGDHVALTTHFDGLWMACDRSSPAASFNGMPTGEGWAEHLDDGLSLDELWNLAAYPDGVFESEVRTDVTGNGANQFDVRLLTGERLLVAVPTELGDVLSVRERRPPRSVYIEADHFSGSIFFEPCDRGALGPNGALLTIRGDELELCRPDERIRLEAFATDEIGLAGPGWDVALLGVGDRTAAFIRTAYSSAGCEFCAPFGPLRFDDTGGAEMIVYRALPSRVIGYAANDLSYRWTARFDPATVSISAVDDLALVDVPSGPIVALDPANGDRLWSMERDAGENDLMVDVVGDGRILVRTSFNGEPGASGAPILRLVDLENGEVIWTTRGLFTESRQWVAEDGLVVDDDTIIVLDEPAHVDPIIAHSSLLAIDLETGNPQWGSSGALNGEQTREPQLLKLEADSGPIVLYLTEEAELRRVVAPDRAGWAVTVGAATVDGTDRAADGRLAISLAGERGRVLIDPETGALVTDDSPNGCVTLFGGNPWMTLWAERVPGCVIAADFQQIRIFNKGFDATTVEWVDGPIDLRPDEFHDTDRVAWDLPVGMSSFTGSPYPMDDVWRMPRSASPTARFSVDGDDFGPVSVGMTLDQAADALDLDLVVDDPMLEGCPVARVANDPYSPLFVHDDEGADPAILEIVPPADWPEAADRLC